MTFVPVRSLIIALTGIAAFFMFFLTSCSHNSWEDTDLRTLQYIATESAKTGDFFKAIQAYSMAIEMDPNNPELYLGRAYCLLEKGLLKEVVNDSSLVISLNPNLYKGYYLRGLARFRQDDYERAISDFSGAIAVNQKKAELYRFRGICYAQLGDFHNAIGDISTVLELSQQDSLDNEFYYYRGQLYSQITDYGAAVSDYSKAIGYSPKNPEYYLASGKAYFYLQDYVRAIDHFSTAIDLDRKCKDAYFFRGYCYDAIGKPEAAIESFKQYIQFDPKNYAPSMEIANIYFFLADYSSAIDWYTRALAVDSTLKEALVRRALCYEKIGDYDRALTTYQTIYGDIPSSITDAFIARNQSVLNIKLTASQVREHALAVMYKKGIEHLNDQKYDKAISDFTYIIDQSDTESQAFYFRGISYYYQGLYGKKDFFAGTKDTSFHESALRDLLRAHELETDNENICMAVGNTYLALGKRQKSIEWFRKALSLNPQNPDTYLHLGLIYQAGLDNQSALACYRTVIELDPRNNKVYCLRAFLYLRSKQYLNALEDLNNLITFAEEQHIAMAYYYKGLTHEQLQEPNNAMEAYTLSLRYARKTSDNLLIEEATERIRILKRRQSAPRHPSIKKEKT